MKTKLDSFQRQTGRELHGLPATYLSIAVLVALAPSVQAVDYTWDGGTGNWNATNWNGASASGPTTAGNTATISSGNVTANVGGPGNLDSITIGSGGQLNFYNGDFSIFAYQGVGNLILQGGIVNGGSATYNAYGASILGNVTVSGSAASTITGGSWFNINPTTTYTVADVTGSAATDLLVNTSLRGPVGSPDTSYNPASIIKEGAGTMEVTFHSYFRGGLTLNGGTLKLSGGNGGYGFFDGAVTVNSGTTLTIDSDGTGFGFQNSWKPTSVNIIGGTVNGGGNHVWGISGGVNMTGGSLQSGGFQWNFTDLITHASADTATVAGPLNLRGDGGYTTMAVAVADGAADTDLLISGNITETYGPMGITKSGAGAMVLSGSNVYTGPTSVQNGTLLITGVHTGGGLITVAAGATLGGNGTVGDVEIADGGILSPGASAGHLTVNHLTLNPSSVLNIELGAPTLVQDPGSDFVTVGQILTLGGTLNIQAISGFGTPASGDSWLIMTAANGIADNGIVIGSQPALPGGMTFTLDYSSGSEVFLTVVPEAGTAGLAALGAVLLRHLCRRRPGGMKR